MLSRLWSAPPIEIQKERHKNSSGSAKSLHSKIRQQTRDTICISITVHYPNEEDTAKRISAERIGVEFFCFLHLMFSLRIWT